MVFRLLIHNTQEPFDRFPRLAAPGLPYCALHPLFFPCQLRVSSAVGLASAPAIVAAAAWHSIFTRGKPAFSRWYLAGHGR